MTSKNNDITSTYAVKLDSDIKEELIDLINNNSEGTAGDFIEVLINTYKTNKLTNTTVDTRAELKELNTLTSRIYNIYNNLIERNAIGVNNIRKDAQEQIQEQNVTIENITEELKQSKNKINELRNEKDNLVKENNKLSQQKDSLISQSIKDNKLITRLENDVKDLENIKNFNKELSSKIESLKNTLFEERELHNALQLAIQDRDKKIMELKKELSSEKERFNNELKNNQTTYALEKQQAVLQLRQEYQEKINNKNIEIQHIKKENIDKIEKYQDKYIEYIKEMEENKLRLEKQIQDLQNQLYNQHKK
jgi:chromosome segregation ATPase